MIHGKDPGLFHKRLDFPNEDTKGEISHKIQDVGQIIRGDTEGHVNVPCKTRLPVQEDSLSTDHHVRDAPLIESGGQTGNQVGGHVNEAPLPGSHHVLSPQGDFSGARLRESVPVPPATRKCERSPPTLPFAGASTVFQTVPTFVDLESFPGFRIVDLPCIKCIHGFQRTFKSKGTLSGPRAGCIFCTP